MTVVHSIDNIVPAHVGLYIIYDHSRARGPSFSLVLISCPAHVQVRFMTMPVY